MAPVMSLFPNQVILRFQGNKSLGGGCYSSRYTDSRWSMGMEVTGFIYPGRNGYLIGGHMSLSPYQCLGQGKPYTSAVLPDPGSCLWREETGKPDQVSGTLAVWLLGCNALWVTATLSLPGPQFLLVQEAGK